MVLRETAIGVRVRTAPGAGPQIRNQFVQLCTGPSRFNPDEDIAGRRSHQQVEVVRRGAMLVPARIQADMASKPAAFEHEAGRRCELADVFANEADRLVREDSVRSWRCPCRRGGLEEFALDLAALIRFEKVLLQTACQKLRLPDCQRWTDTQAGGTGSLRAGCADGVEFILQPRLGIGIQRYFANSERYRVAARHRLGFSAATRPKL